MFIASELAGTHHSVTDLAYADVAAGHGVAVGEGDGEGSAGPELPHATAARRGRS